MLNPSPLKLGSLYGERSRQADCKICGSPAPLFGVLDLNRECSEVSHPRGVAGIPVYYHKCSKCELVFTCAFDKAAAHDWTDLIYNDEYYEYVDPEYQEQRPRQSFELMGALCRKLMATVPVAGLDYGGGNGRLAELLRKEGLDYRTYDPYGHSDIEANADRKANVISSFEVLEHSIGPVETIADMLRFGGERVLIVLSTQVSDGRLDSGILGWDYIAPRSGHVTIYSRKSLQLLAKRFSLDYVPVTRGLHLLSRGMPAESLRSTAIITRAKQLLRMKLRLAPLGLAAAVTQRTEAHDMEFAHELVTCIGRCV